MTPQEAYNKLNTAIELLKEIQTSGLFTFTLSEVTKSGNQELVLAGARAYNNLTFLRDSIELPRQDCSVTLDSVKGGGESGEMG